ncbi:MAG: VTT domain-containing protein [Promethearchaeota archaeon]
MGKLKGADFFIIISTTACVTLAIIMYTESVPELNSFIKSFSNGMIQFGLDNGLWAALLLSMFGNTSVFLVFPYAYVIWILAASKGAEAALVSQATITYPLVLGIISGFGAGVGEITSYIIGRLFTKSEKLINSELGQKFDRMRETFEKHPKSIPFFIYIFALTPLPDDAILVPFGIMKYSYWKTVIPCMLGKMSLTTLLAIAGYYFAPVIENISWLSFIIPSADSNPGDDMLSLLVLFFVVYLMLRVDFDKLMSRGDDKNATNHVSYIKCESCGFEKNEPGSEYCENCGKKLEHQEESSTAKVNDAVEKT